MHNNVLLLFCCLLSKNMYSNLNTRIGRSTHKLVSPFFDRSTLI